MTNSRLTLAKLRHQDQEMGDPEHEKTYCMSVASFWPSHRAYWPASPLPALASRSRIARGRESRSRHDARAATIIPRPRCPATTRTPGRLVTHDVIMRSCCMPPNLVVSGKITNTSDKPIDYVRLHLRFEDKSGKILHGESLYNHHAESLADDAYVEKHPEREAALRSAQAGRRATPSAFSIPMPSCRCFEGRAVLQRHHTVAPRVGPE